jgi:DNA-binding MarR family transcriptional regulator
LTSVSTLHTLDLTGPRRITDLSVIEGVAQPSMTVLVSKLERLGLVERRADPADKRVALVALTASGSDYLQARRRAAADWFARLIDKLPVHEAEALVAATTAIEHLYELEEQQRDRTTRSTARASIGGASEQRPQGHGQPVPPTTGCVGGCVRVRGLLHGDRLGRSDPS